MKHLLLAGVAIGALTFPAVAADVMSRPAPMATTMAMPGISGDLSVYGGAAFTSRGGNNKTYSVLGGLARANLFLSPNIAFQVDLFADSTHQRSDGSKAVMDIAGHLNIRSPGFQYGLMAAVGSSDWWSDRIGTIAGEFLMNNMGPFQLYTQFGFTSELTDPDFNDHAAYVHVEGRYFFNQNLMLAANIGYSRLWLEGGDSGNSVRWGLNLEHKLANSPFGLFLTYQGAHTTRSSSSTLTENTILVGGKFHFNNQSLQWASVNGANTVNFSPLNGINYLRRF